MNTRYKKHLEAFKNAVVSVVSSENPSIILKKGNILKNGKYKLYLTIGMFNKLLQKGELRYVFTDKRKQYYIQNGSSLASIFKSFVPYLKPIAKKFYQLLGLQLQVF